MKNEDEGLDKEPSLPLFLIERRQNKNYYNGFVKSINTLYRKHLSYVKIDNFYESGLLTTLTEKSFKEVLKKVQRISGDYPRNGIKN